MGLTQTDQSFSPCTGSYIQCAFNIVTASWHHIVTEEKKVGGPVLITLHDPPHALSHTHPGLLLSTTGGFLFDPGIYLFFLWALLVERDIIGRRAPYSYPNVSVRTARPSFFTNTQDH